MRIDLIDKWAPVLVCVGWGWLSIRTTSCLRTITRRAVGHTVRRVRLLKLVATVIAATNIFGVALTFHLRWIPSALLAGLIVRLALADKVEEIVPEKPVQDPAAFAEAWREYSRLRRNAIRPVILLLLVGLVGILFVAALETHLTERTLTVLLWIGVSFAVVSFLIFAYNEWKLEYWPCPRCGYRFRGFLVASVMPKHCNHCRLARWSESPE
jgi:hypothetical protein